MTELLAMLKNWRAAYALDKAERELFDRIEAALSPSPSISEGEVDLIAGLGKAKVALFDGKEVDWIAASAAIDAAIEAIQHRAASSLAMPGPEAGDQTYYTDGKDAEWFEGLATDKLSWELTKAAQDIADGNFAALEAWMPICAMLSIAADRLAASKARATTEVEVGWQPIETARKQVDETVLLRIEHMNYAIASDDDKHRWEEVVTAYWTDFNAGGWVWHGLAGSPTHWREIPPPPRTS